VAVHGISRNAREQALRFAPFAEQYGVALVAPVFPRDRYSDYQRLGRLGKGERADLALECIVSEVRQLLDLRADRVHLFGFSGGGQFVHRYAMAHPERVASLAVAAAGWFTFPDADLEFPLGCRPTPDLPDLAFDRERFLRVPVHVFVGSRDRKRGPGFNRSRPLDLLQGRTRIERGRRWVSAMREAARRHRLSTPYSFEILPGCWHSFERCATRGRLGERVFSSLFADIPTPATSISTFGCGEETTSSAAEQAVDAC